MANKEQSKLTTYAPIVAFILGFILFKLLFGNKSSKDSDIKERKAKVSKMIFDQCKEENGAFFFGS